MPSLSPLRRLRRHKRGDPNVHSNSAVAVDLRVDAASPGPLGPLGQSEGGHRRQHHRGHHDEEHVAESDYHLFNNSKHGHSAFYGLFHHHNGSSRGPSPEEVQLSEIVTPQKGHNEVPSVQPVVTVADDTSISIRTATSFFELDRKLSDRSVGSYAVETGQTSEGVVRGKMDTPNNSNRTAPIEKVGGVSWSDMVWLCAISLNVSSDLVTF